MESLKFLLAISVFVSIVLYSKAAPTTIAIHAPSYVIREPLAEVINITPKTSNRETLQLEEGVKTLERFYRVYEDGTTEFKIVLSNGVAQFQKITNKLVNGKTIQVYEGYFSERLPDNSYGTTVYIADENGYRRLRSEFSSNPPVLPPYVPHVPKVTTRAKTV